MVSINPPNRRPRILLVEDEAAVLAALKKFFTREGFGVDGARELAPGIMVASRGRLLGRVEAWNDQTAREFAQDVLAPVVRPADAEPDPLVGFNLTKPAYMEAVKRGIGS